VLLTSPSADQAGLFTLIASGATVISALLAGWALVRSTEANTIARRALEAQTTTRVNVRCRRGGYGLPFRQPLQFPPGVVIVVGENVGGLPVTIESAWVMFLLPGAERGFPLVPTDTGEQFPFPELPQVLPPRSVLQVPMTEAWLQQRLAQELAAFETAEGREFVLRLEDNTGVCFNSPPIRVNQLHDDCAIWVQGASDPPPRSPLGERLRRALRRES
jgi:hypothetical protein